MRMRSALILVDGKRTDGVLLGLVPGPADELLATLLAQGFIEAIAVTDDRSVARQAVAVASRPPPAERPVTASRPPPADRPGVAPTAAAPLKTLAEMRREAARFLTDHLGPSADYLCERIEGAKTAGTLNALLLRARDLLRDARGAAVAERFGRAFLNE